jgi:hypothetical protein
MSDETAILERTFDRLTVVRACAPVVRVWADGKERTFPAVLCRCACGNPTLVQVTIERLLAKVRPTRSCGCLRRDRMLKPIPDGTRIGTRVVTGFAGINDRGEAVYHYVCDCSWKGKATGIVLRAALRNGVHTRCESCARTAPRAPTRQPFSQGFAFGARVITGEAGRDGAGNALYTWHCPPCGRTGTIRAFQVNQIVRAGKPTTCGCASRGSHDPRVSTDARAA